jgi:hypothetical protein
MAPTGRHLHRLQWLAETVASAGATVVKSGKIATQRRKLEITNCEINAGASVGSSNNIV